MLDNYDSLESVRQKAIQMRKFAEYHEKHAPNGMKYVGMKFKSFRDESGMGFRAVPVFEPTPREGEIKGGGNGLR